MYHTATLGPLNRDVVYNKNITITILIVIEVIVFCCHHFVLSFHIHSTLSTLKCKIILLYTCIGLIKLMLRIMERIVSEPKYNG